MERDVSRLDEAMNFLRRKGSKVAVQIGPDGGFVFAEKGDFLKMMRVAVQHYTTFVNYDAEPQSAWIGTQENVLYIPFGIVLPPGD